jgi:hypothetical protein
MRIEGRIIVRVPNVPSEHDWSRLLPIKAGIYVPVLVQSPAHMLIRLTSILFASILVVEDYDANFQWSLNSRVLTSL